MKTSPMSKLSPVSLAAAKSLPHLSATRSSMVIALNQSSESGRSRSHASTPVCGRLCGLRRMSVSSRYLKSAPHGVYPSCAGTQHRYHRAVGIGGNSRAIPSAALRDVVASLLEAGQDRNRLASPRNLLGSFASRSFEDFSELRF